MDPNAEFSIDHRAVPTRQVCPGSPFAGSSPEVWISVAAAFLGPARSLVFREGSGVWHSSVDLSDAQKREMEATVNAQNGESQARLGRDGLWVLEVFAPEARGGLGRLFILAQTPEPLSAGERAGVQRLVSHLETFVSVRSEEERRSLGRGPSGASFVPGLVHELRNFIFGISASLDAFEVRFRGQEEAGKYQTVIRKSLDRLGVFVDELREYGDPGRRPWAEVSLEPILREACEHHNVKARGTGSELHLRVEGTLPRLRGDEQGLRLAFIHLVDLALQARGGAPVEIHLWAAGEPGSVTLHGCLEAPLELGDLDPTRVFEPFYFRPAGLGRLALPVARRILEAHGGELSAAPSASGGVEIRFTLPVI